MRYVIAVLLISSLFSGCAKEKQCGCVLPYQIYYFKAKIIQTRDVACGKPVLDFSEDSLRIRSLTSLHNLTYSVINLPQNVIVQDKKIYVSVANLKPEEEFVCTATGISYPHLKISDTKNRE